MVAFAIDTYNYLFYPVSDDVRRRLFLGGFSTLYHEQQGRMRWLRERRLALQAATH